MTSSTHILFDNIFNNTHSELVSLQQQIEEFQITYQSNIETPTSNNQIEQYSYNQEELDESIDLDKSSLNEPILNNEQINKFKQIYLKNKIDNVENNDDNLIQKIKKKLDKKDEEAQYKKLQTILCCNKKCLQNLVFHEHAITNYQKFQNLNNNQKDMFLLGIISTTIRQETTTKDQKRNKLASKYVFEGIEICNEAFLIIYGIGEKYWRNIRSHFIQYGISPRIHKLTGKISNFAISFEIVLEVLTFIINYANIHGLPSPGILRDTTTKCKHTVYNKD
ncbi:3052_t:CDS:2 [Scutellospora calospora]|uniref:3052_t:CDS:1 n=1 Tax=Scutellospora calospora TaxID=85575 RepID=A0ACA9JU87_9GLOM|nr:3052_t:CDS:2 [Scutellospora calospora]